MNIFVAGSTGVLGRNLLPLLLEAGHSVSTIVRDISRINSVYGYKIKCLRGELLSDEISVLLDLVLQNVDVVIHAATAIPTDFTAPGAWDIDNLLRTEFTDKLIKASLESNSVKYYIQQSIEMAYPDSGDFLINEEIPLDSGYDVILEMENMVKNLTGTGINWTILRGGIFTGKDTFQEKTIKNIKGGEAYIPGTGNNFVSMVNVGDYAEAFVKTIANLPVNKIYNVNDSPIRQKEYYRLLAEKSGVSFLHDDPQEDTPPSFRCNNEKIKTELGWHPVQGIFSLFDKID